MSSEVRIRGIAEGENSLAIRLRGTLEPRSSLGDRVRIERVRPTMGLRFPGEITIPEALPGEQARKDRVSQAIEVARELESDPRAF